MIALLGLIVAWSAAYFGYKESRRFVRERLRYVDGVHRAFVPWKAGLVAAIATLPLTWIIPAITSGAALLFGAAVGFGVAAGRRDIRARRYLGA